MSDFSNLTPEQLEQAAKEMRMRAAGVNPDPAESYPTTIPARPSLPQDRYAVTSWGETEYDFTTPSGQTCRMRKVKPEELVGTGVLDKITRLPGYAQEAIDKAEGQPPVPDKLPSKEDMEALLELLDELIPTVVVAPVVWQMPAAGEAREPGRVYVRDIDLSDRVAIMERAISGVRKFDQFRAAS